MITGLQQVITKNKQVQNNLIYFFAFIINFSISRESLRLALRLRHILGRGVNSIRGVTEISMSSHIGVNYLTRFGNPIRIRGSFHALPGFIHLGILRFGSAEMQTTKPNHCFLIYQIKLTKITK